MDWLNSIKIIGKRAVADWLLEKNNRLFSEGQYHEAIDAGKEALKIYEEYELLIEPIEKFLPSNKELDEGKNKAQTLRQAMLKTMKKHEEPLNWAALLLLGESD